MKKKALIAIVVSIATLAGPIAAPLIAQEAAPQQDARIAIPLVPCPRPYSTVIQGANGAPAPDAADLGPAYATSVGSQWNQTAVDKHFGHTFRFPTTKDCCLITSGTLTIKVKALQGGPPNSATSANDSFTLFSNGVNISQQQPWKNTGVATGATATLTFNVPANVLATGKVSIYGQDDSAFISADLRLQGCCIK